MAAPFVTRDLIARPPSNVLRHASFGASGMAWSDLTELTKFKPVQLVAVAEVDLNRTVELKKAYPQHPNLPGLARVARQGRQAARFGECFHPRPHACADRHERLAVGQERVLPEAADA